MSVRHYCCLTIACVVATLAPRAISQVPSAPPAANANAPRTIQMGRDWSLDAPPTWAYVPDVLYANAFAVRTDGQVIGALQRVGQRPTDLPYAIVEQIYPDTGMDSVAGRHEIAERVADYYRTAVNPPSKASRSPSWKHSKVTPIRYDSTSGQFQFEATLTYDTVGDLHVYVSGLFDRQRVIVFSGWCDAPFDADHPGEISAIRDSMRLIGQDGLPVVSAGAWLRSTAQIVVGLFLATVVVLQIVVWRRDRQARRGEAVELI